MTLNDITRKIQGAVILPTLGQQSEFTVINNVGQLTIRNSGGNELILTEDHVGRVYARYMQLGNQRLKGKQYVHPNWNIGVNKIFDPYIAKIIDVFCGNVALQSVLEEEANVQD